jgi:hypothetical protein
MSVSVSTYASLSVSLFTLRLEGRVVSLGVHSSAFICIHLRDERSCVSVSVSVSSSESMSVSLFIYQGSTRIFRP